MAKKASKGYIERKLSVSKLIRMIPDGQLENIAADMEVDYQVKHLNATLMFKLFLFSILKSERLSSLCKKTPNTALYSFLKQSFTNCKLLNFKNFASLVFDVFLSKT